MVERLQIAPVKGLAAVPRRELVLEPDGVAEDRRVLLLHADGSVVTMRRLPSLVQVVPDLDLEAGTLSVTLPDGSTASSRLSGTTDRAESLLYRKLRTGRLLPGAVADALSALAGEPLRVLVGDRTGVGWDEGPVSLVSAASAAAVASPDGGGGLGRYRMLIEIDGAEPFAEDSWSGRSVAIGGTVLAVSHPLGRCLVINHSPHTGERDWGGLKTLAAVRGADRVTLGVIATVEQPGRIQVGDEVRLA